MSKHAQPRLARYFSFAHSNLFEPAALGRRFAWLAAWPALRSHVDKLAAVVVEQRMRRSLKRAEAMRRPSLILW